MARKPQRRYHSFADALEANLPTPPERQWVFTVEIVLREYDAIEDGDGDRLLDEIRGVGSADVLDAKPLHANDKRRL